MASSVPTAAERMNRDLLWGVKWCVFVCVTVTDGKHGREGTLMAVTSGSGFSLLNSTLCYILQIFYIKLLLS